MQQTQIDPHYASPVLAAALDVDPTLEQAVPQRRVIERGEYEDLKLSVDDLFVGGKLQLYDEISASKYLNVYFKEDKIVFTATRYIGHIPLNDRIALNVIPRFDVANLTRVLRIAEHSPVPLEGFVRTYLKAHERLPSLFDELAAAFLQSIKEVARGGLHTSYTMRKADSSFPRGRILVGDTVRRHHSRGMLFRATSAWHERTYDNGPNRLLKYTMWLVDRRLAAGQPRKGVPRIRTGLNRFYRLFDGVPLDRYRRFLSDPAVLDPTRLPSTRPYYAQATQLALLLVRDEGLDLGRHGGFIKAPSLLVDLQTGFEAYLRNSLGELFNLNPA